ncbi:MAG TPA: acyl-CoA dehydrogenase family protein [Candidatus Binatia bacterium]|nr:acyl-CoA dehydrogenase family protein [Candidatus Binatia bacterium]
MDLTVGGEQAQIRDAIRGVLADRLPLARVRAVVAAPPGFDPDVWREAAALGWFGLGLPEAEGGAGYGTPEEMLLALELGRALAPGPWRGTILAAHAAPRAVRAAVLAGAVRVAVVDDPAGALGAGARLRGTAVDVADAGVAEAFLVLGARRAAWVPRDARGLGVAAAPSIDPTRPLGRLALDDVGAEPVDADPAALRRLGTVLAAAEAAGVAERTLEMSVAYAKVRRQFGRPIGAFQAVKHRCADMAVRAEVARSVVTFAAVALRDGEGDPARHAAVAKALATDAALANAADNVQNHGGIGYTWEADAHLYLKRAWLLEHEFGRRADHWDALAAPWRA